jgi:hypothetical protein
VLRAAGRDLPALNGVVLHESRLERHLAQGAPPCAPFTARGDRQDLWTCSANHPDFADADALVALPRSGLLVRLQALDDDRFHDAIELLTTADTDTENPTPRNSCATSCPGRSTPADPRDPVPIPKDQLCSGPATYRRPAQRSRSRSPPRALPEA